ncbi:MAG: hypothetical protein IBJ11_12745 [Phycisphaerales bacterium]|nr:hypothetical protein [Phycisphaerales bacterium]
MKKALFVGAIIALAGAAQAQVPGTFQFRITGAVASDSTDPSIGAFGSDFSVSGGGLVYSFEDVMTGNPTLSPTVAPQPPAAGAPGGNIGQYNTTYLALSNTIGGTLVNSTGPSIPGATASARRTAAAPGIVARWQWLGSSLGVDGGGNSIRTSTGVRFVMAPAAGNPLLAARTVIGTTSYWGFFIGRYVTTAGTNLQGAIGFKVDTFNQPSPPASPDITIVNLQINGPGVSVGAIDPNNIPGTTVNAGQVYRLVGVTSSFVSLLDGNTYSQTDLFIIADVIPTPGAIGLFGVAGLAALRRRR